MLIYKHRQIGTVILVSLGSAAIGVGVVMLLVPDRPVVLGVLGLVLVVLLVSLFLFWSLTVELTEECLVLRFGPGMIRKRISREEVLEARRVRNHVSDGWGIRRMPQGWLFNVSGFEAVELELRNQQKIRIGTDDPQGLLMSIQGWKIPPGGLG